MSPITRLMANAATTGGTDKTGVNPARAPEGSKAGATADEEGQSDPDSDADEPTEAGQDDGLDEELFEDRAAGGADRFADADLAGSFGDRDQHDIQDADTADDQRDRRDGRDEQDEDAHDLVEGLQPASQGLNLEVPQPGVRDVVAGVEDAGDLRSWRRARRPAGGLAR